MERTVRCWRVRLRGLRSLLAFECAMLGGCSAPEQSEPEAQLLDGPVIRALQPDTVVPGTRLLVTGGAFIPEFGGVSWLHLRGRLAGAWTEYRLPIRFEDYDRIVATWPKDGSAVGDGVLTGEAQLEVRSLVDGRSHVSAPMPVSLTLRPTLEPVLDEIRSQKLVHLNDPIEIRGDRFLLGEEEGNSIALVEGCFRPVKSSLCTPVPRTAIALQPKGRYDRSTALLLFDPRIAGITPGHFLGTVVVRNEPKGAQPSAETRALILESNLIHPELARVFPNQVTLGQYFQIEGAGFVGGTPWGTQQLTTILLDGTFVVGNGPGVRAAPRLVPEYLSGQRLRYVVNEQDELSATFQELRTTGGSFVGSARPIVQVGAQVENGEAIPFSFSLAPVKQIVWLRFLPSYVESLRHFGLRVMDQRIRDRVMDVARRDYAGVNIEFREEEPTDYGQYAVVEIGGPDPNGLGLLGYDNSPAKDNGNTRLYDRIGGKNAKTQEDGYPGFGGIFLESLFGYSRHPGLFAVELAASDPLFDEIFDPVRPDRGGEPACAGDMVDGIPIPLPGGAECPAPAGERRLQIGCAALALGSLIGTTLSHEIGHSLGLANPGGVKAHNPGDQPNRLMDAGDARGFLERVELQGQGPAVFCDQEYTYLRTILPTSAAPPQITRPPCD